MKRIIYLFIGLITLFIGLTFAIQNKQRVELSYYFDWQWTAPIAVIVLVSFAIGVVCGFLANLWALRRMQRKVFKARKQVRLIEQEVDNLRSLPIKDAI